jgi:hypothetical protein
MRQMEQTGEAKIMKARPTTASATAAEHHQLLFQARQRGTPRNTGPHARNDSNNYNSNSTTTLNTKARKLPTVGRTVGRIRLHLPAHRRQSAEHLHGPLQRRVVVVVVAVLTHR